MPEIRSPRLAVLIDADNASAKIADGLFEEVAKIDRKSTRLNSSHITISYAVFCLKKKNNKKKKKRKEKKKKKKNNDEIQ